ncbi:ATP-binding cassette domain-containing protein [Mycoplasma corogypsi]|uniref:ATP-binding cassette domain-containing protein n=1 Tax=Mycoplasma corogypsi TaxID=2106 RepID=UPI0038735B3B
MNYETQIDQNDCMIHVFRHYSRAYLGKDIEYETLKQSVAISKQGTNLATFKKLAQKHNIKIDYYQVNFNSLLMIEKGEYPFGIVIKDGANKHIVLLEKHKATGFVAYNPKLGKVLLDKEELQKKFDGILVNFSPIQEIKSSFYMNEQNKIRFKLQSYFWPKVLYFITLLVELLAVASVPFISKFILSNVIPFKLVDHLIITGLLFLWVSFLNFVFKILYNNYLNKYITYWVSSDLKTVLEYMEYKNIYVLKHLSTLEIKNRLLALYRFLLHKTVFRLLLGFNIITIGFAGYLISQINVLLLIGLSIYVGIILFISLYMMLFQKDHSGKVLDQQLSLDQTFDNLINIIKDNNDVVLRTNYFNKWVSEYKDHVNYSFKYTNHNNAISQLGDFIEQFFSYIFFVIGSIQIWNAKMEIIDLIFFMTAASLFTKPIKSLIPMAQAYEQHRIDNRMLNIFSFDKHYYVNEPHNFRELKIQDLVYETGDENNFKFVIKDFKIFQNLHLVGENGAGKSTFCKLISGIIQPKSGLIVNELNTKLDIYQNTNLKKQILYLDNNEVDLKISVLEYLSIANIDEFDSKIKQYGFNAILSKANLQVFHNTLISNLSKGQLQLIKLLKIILNDYKIIILDEVFENLDPVIYLLVKEKLTDVVLNTIVIEISHNKRYLVEVGSEININQILSKIF